MKVLRSAFFPIEPQSALRSTQTQNWLANVTELEAKQLEDSYKLGYDKKGQQIWVRLGKNGKTKTLKSKPNFVRTRKYLMKYFEYKDELKLHGQKIGFIMPQDAFFMWFFMPMPKSWTKKKKALMAFKLHKNKKDTDNLSKAIKDALAPRKSNFVLGAQPAMDDRVISSYANAKIYLPDAHADKVGVLIVEYDVNEFLTDFFNDAAKIMSIIPDTFIQFLLPR
jgi:Holliday junction resolvase RusA-like endonuclease